MLELVVLIVGWPLAYWFLFRYLRRWDPDMFEPPHRWRRWGLVVLTLLWPGLLVLYLLGSIPPIRRLIMAPVERWELDNPVETVEEQQRRERRRRERDS